MFCPKCGKQLADDAKFCDGCGCQIGAPVKQAKAPKEPFKLPDVRGWVSLAFATLIFVLMFTPFIDASVSVSLLSVEAFQIHALFGIAKIFMIFSMVIYLGYLVLTFLNIGLPSIVKRLLPLGMYGMFVFSQFFVFIACCIRKGVTMGAAWYIILILTGLGVLIELLPKLFNLSQKNGF